MLSFICNSFYFLCPFAMEEKIVEMFFCWRAGKGGGTGEKGRMHGRNILVSRAGWRMASVAAGKTPERRRNPP
ncbi:hypothetical protein [Mailhella massiliensis]|uniref:hypothetical protein n=1 Tax=Mailhella massiliensis TaxID=1903261 RepID=UPI001186F115|nr:hypothetical protein [Mailhella massiliensis]